MQLHGSKIITSVYTSIFILFSTTGLIICDPGDPVQDGGYLGHLWSHKELERDENFFVYDQTYVHPVLFYLRDDCMVTCSETPMCVGYVFSDTCGSGPWECALHLHNTSHLEDATGPHTHSKYFIRLHDRELGIEAAFYDQTESTHYLISGTTVLKYNTLEDFSLGPSDKLNHTSHFFTRWGGQVDDVFERPLFDGDALIKYHLLKGSKQYYYIHLINETGPFRKLFEDTTGNDLGTTFGSHVPPNVGAVLDIRKCTPPCQQDINGQKVSPFIVTYFFKDEHIYESPAETWLEWNVVNGTESYHISSQENTEFPGMPSGVTAALKLYGSDQQVVFFKGLDYYLFDMNEKILKDLGKVSLCPTK